MKHKTKILVLSKLSNKLKGISNVNLIVPLAKASQPEQVPTPTPAEVATTVAESTATTVTSTIAQTPNTGNFISIDMNLL